MTTVIKQLSEEETKDFLEQSKVVNRLDKDWLDLLKKLGFTIDEYSIEKEFKGYHISVEFCIGDFCTGIYSKKNKWLLEKKKSCTSFIEALLNVELYEQRINADEHWSGELD